MPKAAFVRAGAAILRSLGESSTLDGVDCGNVHVARGQRVEANDVLVLRDVATIGVEFAPRKEQTLMHPDGTFVLDALLKDNGVTRKFVLRKA